MDKLLKIMTVVSFGTSVFVLGGAGYLYFNMDNIKEAAKEAAIGAAAGAIGINAGGAISQTGTSIHLN